MCLWKQSALPWFLKMDALPNSNHSKSEGRSYVPLRWHRWFDDFVRPSKIPLVQHRLIWSCLVILFANNTGATSMAPIDCLSRVWWGDLMCHFIFRQKAVVGLRHLSTLSNCGTDPVIIVWEPSSQLILSIPTRRRIPLVLHYNLPIFHQNLLPICVKHHLTILSAKDTGPEILGERGISIA